MKKIILISLALIITTSKPCFCKENNPVKEEFLKAIDAGDVNKVRQMLESNTELANSRKEDKASSESALGYAIRLKNKEIPALLLSNGADVNNARTDETSIDGQLNALFSSAQWDFAEIIPLLISYGANPNQLSENSGPPLACSKKADVVRELIKGGAQVNLKDKHQRTPLHYVCQRGSAEAAQTLIDAGADVNAVDSYGLTPLYFAVANWKLDKKIPELLIAKGANVNANLIRHALEMTNEVGKTRDPNVFEMARFLISNGAKYSIEDVARIGDKDKVLELLEKNPELSKNKRALLAAIYEDNYDIVKLFVQKGADLNDENDRYALPLNAAASAGHIDIVKLLIESGADVNQRGRFGEAALHWASLQRGNNEIAKILIEAGADINTASKGCGSRINVRDNCADQIDIQFKEFEWRENIKKNQQVQRVSPSWNGFAIGDTPLHCACHWGKTELVKMLIASGAKLDSLNEYGQTPLHYAAAFGQKDIVLELLKAGADDKLKTGTGLDAIAIAEKVKNIEIADILKNHIREKGM